MQNIKHIGLTFLAVAMLVSCNNYKRTADIDGMDLDLKIEHFDSALWTLNRDSLPTAVRSLEARYPDIAPIYFERVVEFGSNPDSIAAILQDFYSKDYVQNLYTETMKRFTDLSQQEAELSDAFKRVKYFFPEKPVPHLYTHISGLNQSMVVGEGFISASIDNYLGADFQLYEEVGIYNYLRQNMRSEKLVPDYITAWVMSEFPYNPMTDNELYQEMIYRGKVLYMTSILLPELPDSLLIGYSAEQWQWCQDHEKAMWLTLVGNKHLHSRDALIRNKYLGDSPFTTPFTQDSPGRAGSYVGWQIVNKYMKDNQSVMPAELMYRPAEEILRDAKYNP